MGKAVFGVLAVAYKAAIVALGLLGAGALAGAAVAGFAVQGRRVVRWAGWGALVLLGSVAALAVMPLALVLIPLALGAAVVVMAGRVPLRRTAAARTPWRCRLLLASAFSAATMTVVAAGLMHILVWNPLARMPGLDLDRIYGQMAAAGQGTGSAMIIAWAGIVTVLALALAVCSCVPRWAPFFTPRRICVTGLLLIGATVFFHWFAGFAMEMNMADTFATSGGDAAASGPALAVVGQLALVAALFVALAPIGSRTGRADVAPQG